MGAELYADDINRILIGSVCVWKGEPVFVNSSDNQNHRLQVSYLKDTFLVETVDYRNLEFIYNSPKLGYMNYKKRAHYVTRSPGRGNHTSALVKESLIITPTIESQRSLNPNRHMWFSSKEFADCIKGDHPSFEEALGSVKDGNALSMAFHRYFALERKTRRRIVLKKRGEDEMGIVKDNTILLFEEKARRAIETLIEGSSFHVNCL
jgi:hypothetical protein